MNLKGCQALRAKIISSDKNNIVTNKLLKYSKSLRISIGGILGNKFETSKATSFALSGKYISLTPDGVFFYINKSMFSFIKNLSKAPDIVLVNFLRVGSRKKIARVIFI